MSDVHEEARHAVRQAEAFVRRGNLPQAEVICRFTLDAHGDFGEIWNVLGVIAGKIGAFDFAEDYFTRALRATPPAPSAEQSLARLREFVAMRSPPAPPPAGQRFLLIKS